MEFDAARAIADSALFVHTGRHLSDVEIAILVGAWDGNTYDQIAETAGYSPSYLTRTVGPQLWKLLSDALGEPVSKTNFRAALQRRQQIGTTSDLSFQEVATSPSIPSPIHSSTHPPQTDWGEIVDVSQFNGRTAELELLQHWVERDQCRLVALLGMGGVGKSSLAAKLLQTAADTPDTRFTHIIWRSLRNAPPMETLLSELVLFLSDQEDTQASPKQLLHWFRAHRCLVVLDNVETILQAGDRAGHYRPDYEDYGDLFNLIGESAHCSCLVLTSREKPAEVAMMEGVELGVRSLSLSGSSQVGTAILEAKGLQGSEEQKRELCDRYSGNPLALKIVASSIQDLFKGHIASFMEQNTFLFNGINRLLEKQLERLSYLEKAILYWLTINREWTTIAELLEDIVPPVSPASLLEALESLSWRNLIEKRSGSYTLQPVIMEYVNGCLVERVSTELITGRLVLGDRHALIKTTVKDYIRDSQIRLILQPIAEQFRLAQKPGSKSPANLQNFSSTTMLLKQKVMELIQSLRLTATQYSGYSAGNILNLCFQLGIDLTGIDFSNLIIWHAYLQGAILRNTQFQGARFAKAVFTETLGSVLSIDYNPQDGTLASGDSNGDICIWRTDDGQPTAIFSEHKSWVWTVCYSPDGTRLASGSSDQFLRVWEVSTGRCLWMSDGHGTWVLSSTWSPDGAYLATTGQEGMIRIWDSQTGNCVKVLHLAEAGMSWGAAWHPSRPLLAVGSNNGWVSVWDTESGKRLVVLEGHQNWVTSVAWHPAGRWLASGSSDYTVRVWDFEQRTCIATLPHDSNAWTVRWNPSGSLLACACHDHTARLWDVATGTCTKTLQGHSNWLWDVVWNEDGTRLITASHDQTLMLWNVQTGQRLRTFKGYSSTGWSIVWGQDGNTLYASNTDYSIKIWDVAARRVGRSLKGHSGWVWGIALSPDERYLASGSVDRTLRLWNLETSECVKVLRGHQNTIWCVAWHPHNPHLVATGSHDQTIRLWNTQTGQCLRVLNGHTHFVDTIAWSPDGTYLASSSTDCTLRIWEPDSGDCLQIFQVGQVSSYAMAWHPSGKVLTGGYYDAKIRFWDVTTGTCIKALEGHHSNIWTLSWNREGTRLASGGVDQMVKVWSWELGECVCTLMGHENWINAVAWHPNSTTLASSSEDKTIRLWDTESGTCLQVLSSDRPYEGMNITGVQGLTDAQITTLKALGATESD